MQLPASAAGPGSPVLAAQLQFSKQILPAQAMFNVDNAALGSARSRMSFAVATEYPFGKPTLYASRGRQSAKEYISRGDACLRKGDPAGAERWFGKAATAWPLCHESSFKLGRWTSSMRSSTMARRIMQVYHWLRTAYQCILATASGDTVPKDQQCSHSLAALP